tara:strand:- start:3225 stop:3335 length:111 start_codon:yes stop_codon:yes gene_type:complete
MPFQINNLEKKLLINWLAYQWKGLNIKQGEQYEILF